MGRETLATVLPDGLDPADWLAQNQTDGLAAFTRPGCFSEDPPAVRPVPAGAIIANALCAQLIGSNAELGSKRELIVQRIGRVGAYLPSGEGRQRFAIAAGGVLAQRDLGPDGWLTRKIHTAMTATKAVPSDLQEGISVTL
jgi:hypothetical protein